MRLILSEEDQRALADYATSTPPRCGEATIASDAVRFPGDEGKYRTCEMPAGHTGPHETTYCGKPYSWND